MASFNKVILIGNLTRDPQLSYTASNTPVCKFGLATNRRWRDRNTGEDREETCFVDCTAFGRGGEVINQYMSKGRQLFVEGRLNFSSWEDQQGGRRSKLEVIVENFQFLGDGGQRSGARPAQAGAQGGAGPHGGAGAAPDVDVADDYGPPPDGEPPF